jgi:amino-acid N-acetyltransferase
MELYGESALLRSMVVHPAYRNRHIAGDLVKLLEQKAISQGITAIYLLTETAENYFTKKGYEKISRKVVPAELLASTEFSHVCPASATVMRKQLID